MQGNLESISNKGQRGGGRRLALDEGRRLVLDVLHYSARVPRFPAERFCHLGPLADARSQAAWPISWPVLFAKAYALVGREQPELRRCFLRWPISHLYEQPESVATIAVNRRVQGQDRLFWARLRQPDCVPLIELEQNLTRFRNGPVEQVFRWQLKVSRLPTPLRRLGWWYRLNLSAAQRARRFGTFGLSVLAGQGVYNRLHPHFLTTSLSYGPLESSGRVLVTLLCDHRVLDGIAAARALQSLERMLLGPVMHELRSLGQAAPTTSTPADQRPAA